MAFLEIKNAKLESLSVEALTLTTSEAISENPEYILHIRCSKADVDLDSLLGELVTITINTKPFGDIPRMIPRSISYDDVTRTTTRTYYAYITESYDNGMQGADYSYIIHLSTWLWFLGHNKNSRIFQDLDVLEIVGQIFENYKPSNIVNYRLEMDGSYLKREYCVQFAETDFNFISRLLEDEGIWYYFVHEQGQPMMVITDRQEFNTLTYPYNTIDYQPIPDDSIDDFVGNEGILSLKRSRKVRPTEVVMRDFDYLNPSNQLQASQGGETGIPVIPNLPLEWYDYATGYKEQTRGEQLARLRLELIQANRQLLTGMTNASGLEVGKAFTLAKHPDLGRNRNYKILRTNYTYRRDDTDSSGAGDRIRCNIETLSADLPYRPNLSTQPPRVAGLHSATVVGAPESEVHTDKHARIRVHFHWDRYKNTEEDCSCWVRVVQAWAGKGWGVVAMPRVGQEVVITYVDGDLDRPLVTGIVYNGDNPPPYELPKYINYTGIVSRSLKHGTPQNSNQITLDDQRDKERVIIHAERDLQITVERNSIHDVANDSYEIVRRTKIELYNNHIKYTTCRFSITGLAVDVTAIKKEFIGVRCSFVGTDFKFTGVKMDFTAFKTSVTGVDLSFTGMKMEVYGMKVNLHAVDNKIVALANTIAITSNETVGAGVKSYLKLVSSVGDHTENVGNYVENVSNHIKQVGSFINTIGSEIKTAGVQLKN